MRNEHIAVNVTEKKNPYPYGIFIALAVGPLAFSQISETILLFPKAKLASLSYAICLRVYGAFSFSISISISFSQFSNPPILHLSSLLFPFFIYSITAFPFIGLSSSLLFSSPFPSHQFQHKLNPMDFSLNFCCFFIVHILYHTNRSQIHKLEIYVIL